MNPTASIAFTLPSRVTIEVSDSKSKSQHHSSTTSTTGGEAVTTTGFGIHAEYKDPRSLCTIFILESLKVVSWL